MSYTSIQDLHLIFNNAVSNTTGLHSFHMINENEISKNKNYLYPLCVVEIPNSSISNVNKGWEEHEISCFIMTSSKDKALSDYDKLSVYDNMIVLFEAFLSNVMFQRIGSIIVDNSSIEIERFDNRFSDKCRGIKAAFNVITPSALGYVTTIPTNTLQYTENLYAFFNGYKNVNRTDSALIWRSELHSGVQKAITHNDANNIITHTSPRFNFLNPVSNSTEGFRIPSFTLSGNDFSFFFKMSIPQAAEVDTKTLFTITDPSNGNGVILGITTTGSTTVAGQNLDGQPYLQVDDDNDNGQVDDVRVNPQNPFVGIDLEPLTETVVAVVNDSSNNKTFIHVRQNSIAHLSDSVNEAVNATFDDAELLIGTNEIHEYNFSYRGFVGTMSHIAIYDSAITTPEIIQSVMNQIQDI